MLAYFILAVVIDVVLGFYAILLIANFKIAKDILIEMSNLASCVLFMFLEVVKVFIEMYTEQSWIVSAAIFAVYLAIAIKIIHSISKED